LSKNKNEKFKVSPKIVEIWQGFAEIIVKGILEKKNQKCSCATHVTTVLLVIAALTNGVLKLKFFETLGAELKIINFHVFLNNTTEPSKNS
jgi:hypothetical protein